VSILKGGRGKCDKMSSRSSDNEGRDSVTEH
jgi:hypothetical protein